jgi:hypothetical protein
VYVAVAQRGMPPRGWKGHAVRSADRAARLVDDLFGLAAPEPIPGGEIDAHLERMALVRGQLRAGHPAARPATTRELQWLARRAATRHVAEPLIDAQWKPNALILRDGDEGIAYDPRSQFASLFDAEITREDDHVVVLAPGADGRPVKTYQSFLVLGSLPDHPSFPDPGIELMSAPLAQLDFPVDAVLHAEWIANKRAIAEVRTAIKDAGIALEDAVAGKTTLDDDQLDLQDLGRRAIAYLKGSEKPPLVETVLELAVGAGSLKELRRRVDALREVYGGVVLHHLTAKQEGMYYDHLPRTGGARMRMHRNLMNADLLGALMPTATQHVGHDRGVYVGFTVDLSGSASTPVRWDLTAPAKDNLPTSCYFGGQMGSGKTTAAQLFGALAALMGSIVLTVDPKPDHNITALEILAGHTRVVSLEADERYRGMLDPLACAPRALREDVAISYLLEMLPESVCRGDWETKVLDAVRDTAAHGGGLLDVLEHLDGGDDVAREVARRLRTVSRVGLGILAFGDGTAAAEALPRVTTFRMPGIELPDASLPHDAYEWSDRLAVATFKLLATHIMGLVTRDRRRHKVVILDEAWMFLSTQRGRALLNKLVRMGRSFNTTVIICSQTIEELGPLNDLIGMRAMFGVASVDEARRALTLVGADPDDESLVNMLTDNDVFKQGRCLIRDLAGNTADCQIDLVYQEFLDVLDTSPNAKHALAV